MSVRIRYLVSIMFSISYLRARERGYWRAMSGGPAIYGMIVPIVFIDVATRAYQAVCSPIYGVPKVDRRRYIRLVPRGKGVLPPLDRMHCMYCAYANGVLGFVTAVVAETEKYWCPIRHRAGKDFIHPSHHRDFVSDGDEAALRRVLQKERLS